MPKLKKFSKRVDSKSMELLPVMLRWIPTIHPVSETCLLCALLDLAASFRSSLHNTHDIFRYRFPRRFHSKMTFTFPGVSARLECFDVHLNVVFFTTSPGVVFHKSCACPRWNTVPGIFTTRGLNQLAWVVYFGWSIYFAGGEIVNGYT